MRTSPQAAGNRHLAPINPPYVWRALIWQEDAAGWRLVSVCEMAAEVDARHFATDVTTKPWESGITKMYYVIGEVAS